MADPKPGAAGRPPRDRLVFDDPFDRQTSDDTDEGWGERPGPAGGSGGDPDIARFLAEKPPHHL